MFYFCSHRGPQWNRMWKAGHGLLCGHRGLKPLWNAGHGLLCGRRGLKMEQDLKYWPRFTLWASRFQDGTRREMPAMDYFAGIEVSIWNGTWNAGHVALLWTLRSQYGTGREMLGLVYFVAIEVPRGNGTWNAGHPFPFVAVEIFVAKSKESKKWNEEGSGVCTICCLYSSHAYGLTLSRADRLVFFFLLIDRS
jgi:hypothetical protein